jgi:hypothetical protein
MVEGHIDIGRLDPQTDVHGFLFKERASRSWIENPVDTVVAMSTLRKYVRQLPRTKATFKIGHVVDFADDDRVTPQWIDPEMCWLVGSWQMPDIYAGDETRWVNPNYAHREQYSDIYAECQCGELVDSIPSTNHNVYGDGGHSEDCLVEWRLRAHADIYQRRRQAMTRIALLFQNASDHADRLHVNKHDVGKLTEALDLDFSRLKDIGKEKRKKTMKKLSEEGFAKSQIATVYDLSESTVRDIITRV